MKNIILLGLLAAIFLPRLIGLGNILTVDEPLWLSRGQTFINGLSVGDFGKTLVAGQPGVTTAWLSGLSAPWHSLFAGQMAIALVSGCLVLVSTYFFTLLLGEKWGIITGFFLALDPFLIAHSRIVHTDALLALLYLASLTSLLCALRSKLTETRYIIMSAAFAAGAILTKIFGIVLIPTAIVCSIVGLWYHKKSLVYIAQIVGLWVGTCLVITFIAWPALWMNADKVVDLLSSRAALHSEGTRVEETTSSSWYYARELAFRSSVPVALLLPFALWQWRKIRTSQHALITLVLVTAGLVFVLLLNTGSDKSDRYVLFTHLTLVVAAPLGLRGISLKKWTTLCIALPIIYLAADAIRLYPYYLAHYNRLYPIEVQHKLGWGEGLEQAAAWIQEKHPGTKVFSYYPRVFSYFYPGETETITHIDAASGSYVVVYRSMFERGEGTPESDIVHELLERKERKPEHVITINGLPYAWIFRF